MNLYNKILTLITLFLLLSSTCFAQPSQQKSPKTIHLNDSEVEILRSLAVQDQGRVKPFDTYAKELLTTINGRSSTKDPLDPQKKLSAVEFAWNALLNPSDWSDQAEVLSFRDLKWKKELGLSAEKSRYSLAELKKNSLLMKKVGGFHQAQRQGAKISDHDKKLLDLVHHMEILTKLQRSDSVTLVPNPVSMEQPWFPLATLWQHTPPPQPLEATYNSFQELKTAQLQGGDSTPQLQAFSDALRNLGPYPELRDLQREVHFNHFHPFQKAWICFLIAFCVLIFSPKREGEKLGKLYWTGLAFTSIGFLILCYGFFLRSSIAGRPPVTNMYESVIWVAFGAVLFALIFEITHSQNQYLAAATAGATVCLILADSLPAVFDPTIDPLVPVLRNNFWLTVHVLTITLSYAAFLLALGLGHIVIWNYSRDAGDSRSTTKSYEALYTAIKIGVLLLAAGTILGGVWAAQSWGRFWGWDPKEVWALIALLGYIAILHAKYAGWIGEFGIAAWSIFSFLLVIMAWYGVNFILGTGLHSYGFGTGGVEYISVFVLLEILFVLYCTFHYKKKAQAQ